MDTVGRHIYPQVAELHEIEDDSTELSPSDAATTPSPFWTTHMDMGLELAKANDLGADSGICIPLPIQDASGHT